MGEEEIEYECGVEAPISGVVVYKDGIDFEGVFWGCGMDGMW
jgi:hypothetical protein